MQLTLEVEVTPTGQSAACFRCMTSATAEQRRAVMERADEVWEIARRLSDWLPPPNLASVGKRIASERDEDLELLAATVAVRKDQESSVPDLVALMESSGIIIAALPEISREVSAFSCWFDDLPIVLIRPAGVGHFRSRFDLAHEFGHLILHHHDCRDERQREREANKFAGALLISPQSVDDAFVDGLNWERARVAAKRQQVSLAAFLTRARELHRIGPVTYRTAMAQLSARGWRSLEQDDHMTTIRPTLLHDAWVNAKSHHWQIGSLTHRSSIEEVDQYVENLLGFEVYSFPDTVRRIAGA